MNRFTDAVEEATVKI